MWLDGECQIAVDEFWKLCGKIEAFPRTLEYSVPLALPLTVVRLSHLQLRQVESWLQRRGAPFSFKCQSRSIRGCMIAYSGQGMIFIDESDINSEQRYTIAHELAHFLVDYWLPRQRAIHKFGEQITEVLDGMRKPDFTERINSLLTGVPIGTHINLMERGEVMDSAVWSTEDRADKVALALLAPPNDALSQIDFADLHLFEHRHRKLESVLVDYFGLSSLIASSYSRSLLIAAGKGPSWIENLKLR